MNDVQDNGNERTYGRMDALLDRYLPRRKPLGPEGYNWNSLNLDDLSNDLVECLTFISLVESNPDEPAKRLIDAANRDGTSWLTRFITECWLPEERNHGAVYGEYLVRSGVMTRESLDQEVDTVKRRDFVIGDDYRAAEACTYGWLQELITWRFYQAIHMHMTRSTHEHQTPTTTALKDLVSNVAKEENFHRYIYFEGIRELLNEDPTRVKQVVRAVAEFEMPGHHMAPEYQVKAPNWAQMLKFPYRVVFGDIASGLRELIGYRGLGQSIIGYVKRNEMSNLIKWPVQAVDWTIRPRSLPATLLGRIATSLVPTRPGQGLA